MDVFVVGGHGKVALRVLPLLADRGHIARAAIRNPAHADEIEAAGGRPVIYDLETDNDLARHLDGADAVVFAAGAGPGSGPERKRTVDLNGALDLIHACREAGVSRYVMVSAMGLHRRERYPPSMEAYYVAKLEADEALAGSGLDYTIVRPGRLTDEPGTGKVAVGTPLEAGGEISRDDVAATLLAVLETPATSGRVFDVIGGEVRIAAAIAALAEGQAASSPAGA